MSKRLLLLSLVGILVVGGLVASVFANTIQRALTLPTMQQNKPQGNAPAQQGQGQNMPGKAPTKQMQPMPSPKATTPQIPAQVPMNILSKDSFQRANQPLWGMASDGRQWTGDANMLKDNFSINNMKGRIAGKGTFNALLGPPETVMNMEVLLDGSLSRFDGTVNIGVVVRYTDPNHWYKALLDGTNLTIIKRVDKKTTTLKNMKFAAQNGKAYMLRLRVVGAMLFARAWESGTPEPNTWMLTVADTTFTTGQPGIRVVLAQGLTIDINSFSATNAGGTV